MVAVLREEAPPSPHPPSARLVEIIQPAFTGLASSFDNMMGEMSTARIFGRFDRSPLSDARSPRRRPLSRTHCHRVSVRVRAGGGQSWPYRQDSVIGVAHSFEESRHRVRKSRRICSVHDDYLSIFFPLWSNYIVTYHVAR